MYKFLVVLILRLSYKMIFKNSIIGGVFILDYYSKISIKNFLEKELISVSLITW